MSIVNGLFAGRSGLSSHGAAIAIVGDNISNASTIGYKTSRAEFEDLIAGSGGRGKTIGSGSQLSKVTTDYSQGTLEFTNKNLDLAIDGNGFFVVADGAQRFYTRAGNFTVNSAGNITDQQGRAVLGYPSGGSGALETLNINSVTSSTSATTNVTIQGNLDANSTGVNIDTLFGADPHTSGGTLEAVLAGANPAGGPEVTYAELAASAEFQTVVDVVDGLGDSHTVTIYFYRDQSAANTWEVRAYVNSDDVDPGTAESGEPRLLGRTGFSFPASGVRAEPTTADITLTDIAATGSGGIPWNNGSDVTQDIDITFYPFTQFAASSNITAISQDGQGVGAVTSVNIEADGSIFALLDNGETTTIGQIGLVNFSNPEGLIRVGSNLLSQSNTSGEPIQGTPDSGTFGSIQSGSLELSTVDIANEFVKLLIFQRGFSANSRIITTIDRLMGEVIQLV